MISLAWSKVSRRRFMMSCGAQSDAQHSSTSSPPDDPPPLMASQKIRAKQRPGA